MRSDDLTPYLGGGDQSEVGLRQGVVVSFDVATGANQVDVGGALLSDLPFLENSGVVNLAAGDVVVLQRWRSSWFIIGRVIPVGSPKFASASLATAGSPAQATGFNVTTSAAVKCTTTIPVPAWANRALVTATAVVSKKNTTGAFDYCSGDLLIDGNPSEPVFIALGSLQFGLMPLSHSRSDYAVTPGGLVTVQVRLYTTVATWANDPSDRVNLNPVAIFRRQ